MDVEIILQTNNQTLHHNTSLYPGLTYEWNDIRLSLTLEQQMNVLVTDKFLSDGLRTSVFSGEEEQQILLHCQRNESGSYTNFSFSPEICVCNPVGTTVNCRCKDEYGPSRLMSPHSLLPRKQGNIWINPSDDGPIAELELPAMQLGLSVNGLEARTNVDASHCHVTATPLSGCYNCERGATTNVTCSTDFGTAVAIAQCDAEQLVFPLHCTDKSSAEVITLNLKHPKPRLLCTVHCPASKVNLWLEGQLNAPGFMEILNSVKAQNFQTDKNSKLSFLWEFLVASAQYTRNFLALAWNLITIYPFILFAFSPLLIILLVRILLPSFLFRIPIIIFHFFIKPLISPRT